MDSSGFTSSYKLHLALAALVGASSAAVAAYYLHYRAVTQVARSASTNRRRTRPPAPAPGGGGGKLPPPRRAAVGSASLPDLSAFYDVGSRGDGGLASGGYLVEEEEEDDAHGVVGPHVNGGALDPAEFLQIPPGLPRLQVGPDSSKQFARSVSTRRVEIIRPKSPKSLGASASALESADGSDDAIQNSGKLDNGYINTNGNLSHWIGKNYFKRGLAGNDIHRTNVPHIRVQFREMIWRNEMKLVYSDNEILIPDELDLCWKSA